MKQFKWLILFVMLFFVFPYTSKAGKVVPLPQLEKPNSITTDNRYIYITDQETVSIYSAKDFKLKNTFGKIGEGPGQFKLLPREKVGLRIALHDDYILVNSAGRASFFTKDGKFKDLFKLIDPVQFLKPLGNKYVGFKGISYSNMLFINFNLYTPMNTKIKRVKIAREFWRKEHYGQINYILDCFRLAMAMKEESRRGALYQVYNNQVFIEGNNNEIVVFNDLGIKLNTIQHDYEKIKIPDSFKQKIMAFFEKSYPTLYQGAKNRGKFPRYFPIRYFHVTDDKIYVLTFKNQENKSEFYLLDLAGNLLKKVSVPFSDAEFLQAYPYTVNNSNLYQLIKNPDKKLWELHIHEVK